MAGFSDESVQVRNLTIAVEKLTAQVQEIVAAAVASSSDANFTTLLRDRLMAANTGVPSASF
jgi:hypothetical protein